MSLRLTSIVFAVVTILLSSSTCSALPPLGLTQIRVADDASARVAIVDETAYVSTKVGIYPVDFLGLRPALIPNPSGFGPLIRTTRVVKSEANDIVAAATFDSQFGGSGGVVAYTLSDVQTPLVSWSLGVRAQAIDSTLEVIAIGDDGYLLSNDGSAIVMGSGGIRFVGTDMTPSGVAIGSGTVPGTVGAAPAIREPGGGVTLLGSFGEQGGIRLRSDGQSLNYGYSEDWFTIAYSDSTELNIDESIGRISFGGMVHVSETDFVVVQADNPNTSVDDFLAYFPGINPAGIDRSVPLFDLFPELTTIDFDDITDISSSEGQIHLLLSGDDGLWLFAARDPSVVPEPSSVCIGAMLVVGFAALRERRG